jgi:hypothetical protein
MTTQKRRKELCEPLNVILTVQRAAGKLLKFARPIKNKVGAAVATDKATRSGLVPALDKQAI